MGIAELIEDNVNDNLGALKSAFAEEEEDDEDEDDLQIAGLKM